MDKFQADIVKVKTESSNDLGSLLPSEKVKSIYYPSFKYVDPEADQIKPPSNFGGPSPSFKWLCEQLFTKVSNIKRDQAFRTAAGGGVRDRKIDVIKLFYKEWRSVVGPNIYPALRLIIPHRDRSRIYNMKENKLGSILLNILKLSKKSETFLEIFKWKRSEASRNRKFSDVCVQAIEERQQDIQGGSISIDGLNELLDKLADYENSKQEQTKIIKYFIENMSFLELKYTFDIIMKVNILGYVENSALVAWHPDAYDYINVVTSLQTVAYKLYDPSIRLNEDDLKINLLKPFSPQLAKKVDTNSNYNKVINSLNGEFFIEEKMDGERIQLHYAQYGEEIKYWSRKATDYSYLYGRNKREGCISPHIKFKVDGVKECVLDGEVVAYNPVSNTILPFGIVKGSALQYLAISAEKKAQKDDTPRPLFFVFDILYLNGKSLANVALEERKRFLNSILENDENFVEKIKSVSANSEEQIKSSLVKVLERGSEGLVLKKKLSRYHINQRDESWVKVKPEYLKDFGENVDLIVIGRELSKKHMFYCGVRITDEDTSTIKKPMFWSFCRVANGFDKNDYAKIEDLTLGKWKDFDEEKPPIDLIDFGPHGKPQQWIDPRDSIVIEVRARSTDREIFSKNYRTPTTLFNAYSRTIREDKDWTNSITYDEYLNLKESHRDFDELQSFRLLQKNKRLKRNRFIRDKKDEEDWSLQSSKKSNILSGFTFMVLSDSVYNGHKISIDDMIRLIKVNGGDVIKLVDNCAKEAKLRIISDIQVIQSLALHERGLDILKSSFIFDSIRIGQVINIEERHLTKKVSRQLAESTKDKVDSLGNSFMNPFTVETFESLVETSNYEGNGIMEGLYEYLELFGGYKFFIFHRSTQEELQLLQICIESNGGLITTDVKDSDIVIVKNFEGSESELSELRRRVADSSTFTEASISSRRVVTEQWIYDCLKEDCEVDPQDYGIPVLKN
ncbi:hypothetical protein WICMUC_002828 [Wickerhamomyces mucosus]|uniref:DNA ligase n=1 Tax=Wickerhamomyces mucosus TaxID=1378264 RepID=A0A9P8PNI6_9ASCO|nr:hypothetical protein WICMUC_002828 [Wickerhamomyces mucosus]